MVSHPMDSNDSRAWEIIFSYYFVTMLLQYLQLYFFFSIIARVHLHFGQITIFFVSVAKDRLRFELESRNNFAPVYQHCEKLIDHGGLKFRKCDNRVCFRVANCDTAIFFCNFDLNFYTFLSVVHSKIYLAFHYFKLNYRFIAFNLNNFRVLAHLKQVFAPRVWQSNLHIEVATYQNPTVSHPLFSGFQKNLFNKKKKNRKGNSF